VRTSEIQHDEHVVFFQTSAHVDAASGDWVVPIHGIVFEPEEDSLKRRALVSLIRKSIGLSKDDLESEVFRRRAMHFLVDNERGKRIVIRIAGRTVRLSRSGANGHFRGTLTLTRREANDALDAQGTTDRWLDFEAIAADQRRFRGRVRLIEDQGWSVISDVDDTIKHTAVHDRKELLRNTFLREFEPIPGMAATYRRWSDAGAAFHYLSASPWQLYRPLSRFIDSEGFPAGTFHLKRFRMKDSTAINVVASPRDYKRRRILELLDRYPRREFVLVGDSGERDPEIYGRIARERPDRIRNVFIRKAGEQPPRSSRLVRAFRDVAIDRWRVFDRGDEIG
jgi:phosphatidate phosphatase APP1